MYTICEAKLALLIAVPTVYWSRGSREVRPRRGEKFRRGRSSDTHICKHAERKKWLFIENAYRYCLAQFRNTWIIIHVKRVNKQFSYREHNALSIIKTDERAIPSPRT